MHIAISGSLAYDYIMDFPDSFKNHILPDHIHMLNVSFLVDKLNKNIGGVAGNIAYTMKLLGADPLIVGPLGQDNAPYLEHLSANSISPRYISTDDETYTASAYITTDKDGNQISAFYPGALATASTISLDTIEEQLGFVLISPTDKDAMLAHSKQAHEKEIPIVFDPGQQIPALSAQELQMLIGQATYVIGNDYEIKMIEDKTGWSGQKMLEHADVLITTLGAKGSIITTSEEYITVAPATPTSTDDPTGAGDAYRAGFFAARLKGQDLNTCGQVGSVAASFAIEHYGTQKHHFGMDDFWARYTKTYDNYPAWS